MALEELQLVHVLLWMIFIIALWAILFVVHQLDQLGNSTQETGNPVETADDRNVGVLPYPIQETQCPGIHPSMAFRGAIAEEQERMRNRFRAMRMRLDREHDERETPMQCSRVQGPFACEERQEPEREVREVNEESEVKEAQAEGVQQEIALADSSHAVGNNSELSKGKKEDKEESGEQPSLVPEQPESTELLSLPGDLDCSDPNATSSETNDAQTASDEQPADMNATACVPSANPNKKTKGNKKKKKKKKSKKSFDKRSSDYVVAAVSDPETSTDESHHSSIEAFSSDFEEMKNDQGEKQYSEPAACAKEKRLDN